MVFEGHNIADRRIAKNTIFLSIRMLVVLCVNLYTTRIVLENLGVDNYGIYNVVCGFVSLFMFINTSLSNGIQRFYNYELGEAGEDGLGKVYSTAILMQVMVIVIMLVLTETLGLWYLNNKMVIPPDRVFASRCIYQFSIASFILIILQSPFSAAVLAFERMDYYALVSVIVTILKLGVALSLTYLGGDKLIIYSFLLLVVSFLEYILYFIYVKFNFKALRLVRLTNFSLFKSMFAFSGWNLFGSFANIMKEQGINLILNLFYGPVVNAARAIAVQVSGGLQSFVSNFTIPVRPQVIKSFAAGDIDRTISLTFIISKLSCYFLYILSLPILIEIDFVLRLWLGNEVPEYTSSFIIIIVVTSFLSNLNAAVSGVVHASGKMMRYQLLTSFVSLMSLPLAYLILNNGANPNWALLMVLLTMVAVQVVSLFVLKKIVAISLLDYLKKIILPVCAVVAVSILPSYIPYFCMDEGPLRFVVTLITSIFVVALSIYIVGINNTEKQIINNILSKVFKKN